MIPATVLDADWPVHKFSELDSTSLEAARRAEAGHQGPCWIVAETQTGGKGRLGRKWISDPGNLYATALMPLTRISQDVPCLALVSGLAVSDAILVLSAGKIITGVKWPNDVRVNGAKISGILLEAGKDLKGSHWLSFGIGINLNMYPDVPGYETTSLKFLLGRDTDIDNALRTLDDCLRSRLRQLISDGRPSVIEDWLKRTDQTGQYCRSVIGGKTVEGMFSGLDEFGQLRLRLDDGGTVTISAGDVELVKERRHASGN